MVQERKTCRLCANKKLRTIVDLGKQPPANNFLRPKDIHREKEYPLCVVACSNPSCGFVQLKHVVDPDILFEDYLYVSSTSPVFVKHFEEYAKAMHARLNLKGALTLDIGSNDGVLVKPLKALGARSMGIDPAKKIAREATKNGYETAVGYFTGAFAKKLVKQKGQAKLITANNVFAHIDDLDEVMRGVSVLLSRDGLFTIEAPYIHDYLEKNLYDTTYHEHLSYLGVRPLQRFFQRFNMHIVDVVRVDTHGGSARIMVARTDSDFTEKPIVADMTKDEQKRTLRLLGQFAKSVRKNKVDLLKVFSDIKRRGKKIAAYGAPAKGNTLLNYLGSGTETFEYIVDDNPLKQGLVSPGMHIPVVSSAVLEKNPPDYLVLLAWNFAKPIIEKNKKYSENGGKFIIPIPKPKIV